MKQTVIILISLAFVVGGCNEVATKKQPTMVTIDSINEQSENNSKFGENENKQIFYRVLNNTVYTYQKFIIENRELVMDFMDMDSYGYHILSIKEQGDTIITMTFDKEFNPWDYIEKGQLKLVDSYLPNAPKTMTLHKDRSTFIWKIFINKDNEPYKFLILDSINIKESGYFLDTVNHWLDDVEF
jgi:hypothetical protein